jgi:hypothetical protein
VRGKGTKGPENPEKFRIFTIFGIQDYYIWDYYILEKFVAPKSVCFLNFIFNAFFIPPTGDSLFLRVQVRKMLDPLGRDEGQPTLGRLPGVKVIKLSVFVTDKRGGGVIKGVLDYDSWHFLVLGKFLGLV